MHDLDDLLNELLCFLFLIIVTLFHDLIQNPVNVSFISDAGVGGYSSGGEIHEENGDECLDSGCASGCAGAQLRLEY